MLPWLCCIILSKMTRYAACLIFVDWRRQQVSRRKGSGGMGYNLNPERSGRQLGARGMHGRLTITRIGLVVMVFAAMSMVNACSTDQVHSSELNNSISLKAGDIRRGGIAFITPSTATGHEQDKQTLALAFGDVLMKERPRYQVVSLAQTLSDINRAGLASEYKHMYRDYQDTGIFDRRTLQRIGQVVGVRYLAQLKLAGFSQGSNERFGALGVRLLQTLHANIRLFLQIWDSKDGTIAWEGADELNYAYDTDKEKPVTFRTVAQGAARRLIAKLP